MNKFFNKSVVTVIAIGLLATICLIVIFQSPLIKKVNQQPIKETVVKEDDTKIKTSTFADKDLGITFKYPADLQIITNNNAPVDQPMWLEITSSLTSDLLKETYWQKNLAKLALGETVVLPGDLYIEKSALKAMVGSYPVIIYTEVSYKNCQENYNDKLIALINDQLVTLTLRHAPGFLSNELQRSTSTVDLIKDCKNKNLNIYNTVELAENIKNGKIGDNLKISINYFSTILSSLEVTKTRPELNASSTPAIIDLPSVSKDGNLSLGVDEVVVLYGDDAQTQMKKDKACSDNCQVPKSGYIINQTKKIKTYELDLNPFIAINYSNSTSTPAQVTQVNLPILIEHLKQNKDDKFFNVYFDEAKDKIIGLEQR